MRSVILHIILIAILGLLVYSNTFNVPFVLDDLHFISENPLITDLTYFSDSSALDEFPEDQYKGPLSKGVFQRRLLSFLTFAINFKLNGLDVTGFHAVDTALHILNALLLYLIVTITFRTPFMLSSSINERAPSVALFSALIFVSHPIQTQAVTYLSQRFVLLATFFVLLSLTAYVWSRLSSKTSLRYTLYALALISAAAAMKSKEIAFTLPVLIALYEILFFRGNLKQRALHLAPFFLTMLIIPINLLLTSGSIETAFKAGTQSRWDYLITQFRVMLTYIRLIVLPVDQNLDYDYPLFLSFFNPSVFLSFLFLLSLFGLGIYLLKRSRKGDVALRFSAFGIFWFFIALSVESSIIPITDVIFEHRVYLPSTGAFCALGTGAFLLLERLKEKAMRKVFIAFLVVIPLVFSAATYARNSVWKDGISLWEDVVRKSPNKTRGHYNLGTHYQDKELIDRAIEQYQITLDIDPEFAEAHDNLGMVFQLKGMSDKAEEHIRMAMRLRPDFKTSVVDRTIQYYKTVIEQDPDNVDAYNNLGYTYFSIGKIDEALKYYHGALRLNSNYSNAYFNIGEAYFSKGMIDKSIEYYRSFLYYRPDYADAHYNIGVAYNSKSLFDEAIKHFQNALNLNLDSADLHNNLGFAFREKGHWEEARREFETALRINSDHHKARWNLDQINKTRPH